MLRNPWLTRHEVEEGNKQREEEVHDESLLEVRLSREDQEDLSVVDLREEEGQEDNLLDNSKVGEVQVCSVRLEEL